MRFKPRSSAATILEFEQRPKPLGHHGRLNTTVFSALFKIKIYRLVPVLDTRGVGRGPWHGWRRPHRVKHRLERFHSFEQFEQQMAAQSGAHLSLSTRLVLFHVFPSFKQGRDGYGDDERLKLEAVPGDQDGDKNTEPIINWLIFDGDLCEEVVVGVRSSSVAKSC